MICEPLTSYEWREGHDNDGKQFETTNIIMELSPIWFIYVFISSKYLSLKQNVYLQLILVNSKSSGLEVLYRGSYMSAHVLLNLLNELGKRDKMKGLPSILSFSQRV